MMEWGWGEQKKKKRWLSCKSTQLSTLQSVRIFHIKGVSVSPQSHDLGSIRFGSQWCPSALWFMNTVWLSPTIEE